MRRRLIHAYEQVDWDLGWKAANDRAPSLIPTWNGILAELESQK
jgi:uncharacterized protein with HEPN domain